MADRRGETGIERSSSRMVTDRSATFDTHPRAMAVTATARATSLAVCGRSHQSAQRDERAGKRGILQSR
jgi:hypothetical protein